jgi:ParB-like chromosome segregation protein Spo0J
MERGRGLPPVELYKLGATYYVLDGHHRVAAARLNGQLEIDAYVAEYVPRETCACA